MPGSPVGGPGGPGATQMLSPGAGAGMHATNIEKIKQAMRIIQMAALNLDPGTREFNAAMGALTKLNPIFGKPSDSDTGPAARAQLAQPPPGPLAGMAPTGMAGGGGPPPQAMPPGMGPSEVGGGNPAFP